MTSDNASDELRFWRHRSRTFILFREIVSVSAVESAVRDVIWMSARGAVMPEKDSAPYN